MTESDEDDGSGDERGGGRRSTGGSRGPATWQEVRVFRRATATGRARAGAAARGARAPASKGPDQAAAGLRRPPRGYRCCSAPTDHGPQRRRAAPSPLPAPAQQRTGLPPLWRPPKLRRPLLLSPPTQVDRGELAASALSLISSIAQTAPTDDKSRDAVWHPTTTVTVTQELVDPLGMGRIDPQAMRLVRGAGGGGGLARSGARVRSRAAATPSGWWARRLRAPAAARACRDLAAVKTPPPLAPSSALLHRPCPRARPRRSRARRARRPPRRASTRRASTSTPRRRWGAGAAGAAAAGPSQTQPTGPLWEPSSPRAPGDLPHSCVPAGRERTGAHTPNTR